MNRYDLTGARSPPLPQKPGGVPRIDDRSVLNGISGCRVPARHGGGRRAMVWARGVVPTVSQPRPSPIAGVRIGP